MNNCRDKLLLELKQGESRSFRFTILENEQPLNLTNYNIIFQVRKSPYLNVNPFINKVITNTISQEDGMIDKPLEGSFYVYIATQDFNNMPPKDYYVSIYITNGVDTFSISGTGNEASIIRFCKC